jgi:bacterioferritin-associated ferredoxin
MNSCPAPASDRGTCPARLICRCLQVSEDVLLAALHRFELRTVQEVREHTGAGDGCTACHRAIRRLLARHAEQGPEWQPACAGQVILEASDPACYH